MGAIPAKLSWINVHPAKHTVCNPRSMATGNTASLGVHTTDRLCPESAKPRSQTVPRSISSTCRKQVRQCGVLACTSADKSRLARRTSFILGAIRPEDIMEPDTGADKDGGPPRELAFAEKPRTAAVLVFAPFCP